MSAHVGLSRRRVIASLAAATVAPLLPGRLRAADDSFPVKPQRLVADIRAAMVGFAAYQSFM